jgi:hypothetical protein
MIKDDATLALKRRAEQSGESEDWAAYAEALEDRIESPHAALLYEGGSTNELTKESVKAHRAALEVIEGSDDLVTVPVQLMMDRRTEFVYIVEVRGQSSVTAHGKQGLRPIRGAVLERANESGLPVLFAIQDGKKWRVAWMSELGPAVPISKGDDGAKDETARAGWPVSEFRTEEEIAFPATYDPRERAQGTLG